MIENKLQVCTQMVETQLRMEVHGAATVEYLLFSLVCEQFVDVVCLLLLLVVVVVVGGTVNGTFRTAMEFFRSPNSPLQQQ